MDQETQHPAFLEFLTNHGGKVMYSPELLNDPLITILCIKKELKGSDIEKVKVAQEAYQELLDDFYNEYEDKLASNQYLILIGKYSRKFRL